MHKMLAQNFVRACGGALIFVLLSAGQQGHASTWSVINLHPGSATASRAYGVEGGQQVGYAFFPPNGPRASLWTGSAGSWVDLHPPALASIAYAVHGGQQAGMAGIAQQQASLWTGSAGSWINLNPPGSSLSEAFDVFNGQQVGYSGPSTNQSRATLWNSSPGSAVILQPPGALSSSAFGIHGGQQVGSVSLPGSLRAALWSGSASSHVDLHPAGATGSVAYAVYAGTQVGYAVFGGVQGAAVWTGTSGSYMNLHPAGATSSVAYDIWNGRMVGEAVFGSTQHAGLWDVGNGNFQDLHQYLPSGFTYSVARGIWEDPFGQLYVVGWGFNSITNREEALMWVVPEPGSLLALGAGIGALALRWRRARR
jgi:hypothetical protein